MRIALALIVLALAPATAHAGQGIDRIASRAAGEPVMVACSVPAGSPEAGWTVIGSSQVAVTADACRALGHLAAGDAAWLRGSSDHVDRVYLAGAAVQVIVHEATHLRLASGDEALVECTASRNYWPAIAALHLPARLAGRILAAALYVHRNLRDALYRSAC